jgi:hypothetical protein
VKSFPCFYVEELRVELKQKFPGPGFRFSHATILRALRFDLGLTRKVLEKRAREAVPLEIATYKSKMQSFYSYPEQVVFVDETSKNGADAARKYAWSRRGTRAVVVASSSGGEFVLCSAGTWCSVSECPNAVRVYGNATVNIFASKFGILGTLFSLVITVDVVLVGDVFFWHFGRDKRLEDAVREKIVRWEAEQSA